MSATASSPPRRIAPQAGLHAWLAAELTPSERMIPLGAEHAAEVAAEGSAPRLDALATELRARLDHGRGLALLRGLPLGEDPGAAGRALAARLGTPLSPEPAGDALHAEACDALLLRIVEAGPVPLRAAASVHDALLRTDREALAALYVGDPPVFSLAEGRFAARWDDAALPPAAVPALAAAAEDAALLLHLDLRAGDLLVLNPLLVWAGRPRGALLAAARTEPSRLDSLRPARREAEPA